MNQFSIPNADRRLDLTRCLGSGQVFRWRTVEDGRRLLIDGQCWFLIREADDMLEVESNFPRQSFESLFRLDADAEAVEREILETGPELAPYAESLRGLRLLRPSDAEEVFFCFLCSANNHISRIGQLIRKLAAYGEEFAQVLGEPVHRFPAAEVIAAISEGELRGKGFGYRGASIPAAARALADRGPGWLKQLRTAEYETVHRELLAIPSVGPKLADCIALYGLDRTDVVPIDTHIWQAFTRHYFPEWAGQNLTAKRYEVASSFFRARFGKHAAWAHQYLFYDNVLNWRTRR